MSSLYFQSDFLSDFLTDYHPHHLKQRMCRNLDHLDFALADHVETDAHCLQIPDLSSDLNGCLHIQ